VYERAAARNANGGRIKVNGTGKSQQRDPNQQKNEQNGPFKYDLLVFHEPK
jgi:hypothetical protein